MYFEYINISLNIFRSQIDANCLCGAQGTDFCSCNKLIPRPQPVVQFESKPRRVCNCGIVGPQEFRPVGDRCSCNDEIIRPAPLLPVFKNVRFPGLDSCDKTVVLEEGVGDVFNGFNGFADMKSNIDNVVVSFVDGIAGIKDKLCDCFNWNWNLDDGNCFGGVLDNNIFKF